MAALVFCFRILVEILGWNFPNGVWRVMRLVVVV